MNNNALIKNLESIKNRLETDSELDMDILHIAKFWADDIGNAIDELHNKEWIPCRERLPEQDYRTIKVTLRCENGYSYVTTLRYEYGEWKRLNGRKVASCYRVVAWIEPTRLKPYK